MIYPETIVNCDNCGMLNAFNEEHFITYASVNCRCCGHTVQVPDENKALDHYEYLEARNEVMRDIEKNLTDTELLWLKGQSWWTRS